MPTRLPVRAKLFEKNALRVQTGSSTCVILTPFGRPDSTGDEGFRMTMPDRSATITAFYHRPENRQYFTADRHDENRRRSLPFLIAHLESVHPEDRGKWGVLVKTDQHNKVPCDVLVWKDNQQSVDVMTDHGGLWGPHPGTIADGGPWLWAPSSVVDPTGEERALQGPPYDGAVTPPPPPPDPPPPPVDLGPLSARLDALTMEVGALRTLVQQLIDRPAPSVTAPPVTVPAVVFPDYEGTINLGGLFGTAPVTLKPKP
jgi:hypothetical protein